MPDTAIRGCCSLTVTDIQETKRTQCTIELTQKRNIMDEGTVNESVPDLKDLEVKIGRKTPEGLLKWMREEASSHRGDGKLNSQETKDRDTGRKSLDEKIRKLKVEMVRIWQ